MVQRAYGPVNPSVTTGDELSVELQEFWDSFVTTNSGPSTPPYANTGTIWFQAPPNSAGSTRTLYLRNAGKDVPLIEFNGGSARLHPTLIALPIGGIIMWAQSLSTVPAGFATCDGRTHNRSDGNGTIATPDLRGQFVRGAYATGDPVKTRAGRKETDNIKTTTGGAIPGRRTNFSGTHTHGGGRTSGHRLTLNQIPNHTHGMPSAGKMSRPDPLGNRDYGYTSDTFISSGAINELSTASGGNGSHSHGISGGGSHDHYVSSVPAHSHNLTVPFPEYTVMGFIMRI